MTNESMRNALENLVAECRAVQAYVNHEGSDDESDRFNQAVKDAEAALAAADVPPKLPASVVFPAAVVGDAAAGAYYRADEIRKLLMGAASAVRVVVGKSFRSRNGATCEIKNKTFLHYFGSFGPGNENRQFTEDGRYVGIGSRSPEPDPWDLVEEIETANQD